jgi:hypothetical protein
MMIRAIVLSGLAGFVLPAPAVWAWGASTHRAVLQEAVDVLPGPLKGFYQQHRRELPSLAPETRGPADGLERRFAVDRLLSFPFRELARNESELTKRFGEEAKSVGRLPWLVHEAYPRLVAAYRAGDKDGILVESDLLAGLVADLYNPLALTDNADGQKTGQPGLWVRFAEKFPARLSRGKLDGDGAYLLDDPPGHALSIIAGTYVWLDNVLYADALAYRQDSSYTGVYYESLDRHAGGIVRDRLSRASRDVASYWYTAWMAAGKPELR